MENVSYILPLAILRLLLLIPYNYHTYSGTRLRLPALYSAIHIVSGIAVFIHFLAFSIYSQQRPANKSKSVSIDFFDDGGYFNSSSTGEIELGTEGDFDEVYAGKDSNTAYEFDLIWVLLTLSLCSICLHIVILLHVRSTAPTNDVIRRKFEEGQSYGSYRSIPKKRKMLAYWIYDRYRNENNVESFEGDNNIFFEKKRNTVQQLSPVPSTDKKHLKYVLDPDLSVSDGEDNSDSLISSDSDYYDAEESRDEPDSFILYNGTSDSLQVDNGNGAMSSEDQIYFFPSEEQLNNTDSPPSTRRRKRQQLNSAGSSSWGGSGRTQSHRARVD